MRITGYRMNTYFAMLVVTIFASGAALLIVHIAVAKEFPALQEGSVNEYASLESSLLGR